MYRKVTLSILTVALSAAIAAPASAEAPKTGESLYLFGHDASLIGELPLSILGVGYQLTFVPKGSQNSSWNLAIEYGWGKNKFSRINTGVTDVSELDATSIGGVVGYDRYYDGGNLQGGPVLYYDNLSFTSKSTGDPDNKFKATNTFGVGGHFGGGFALAKNVRLFGDMRDVIGVSSYDETKEGIEQKWSACRFITSYSGGVSWTFGH
jgi:hypothetical protein